MIVIVRQAGWK